MSRGKPAKKSVIPELAQALGAELPEDYQGFLTGFGALAVSMESDRKWADLTRLDEPPEWSQRFFVLKFLGHSELPEYDVVQTAKSFRTLTGSKNFPILQLGGVGQVIPDCLCLTPQGTLLEWSEAGGWHELDETFGDAFIRLVHQQAELAESLIAHTVSPENRETFLNELELSGHDDTAEQSRAGFHLKRLAVLDAVAVYAGIVHRDQFGQLDWQRTASPALGAFVNGWAYGLDKSTRQELKKYIPRLVGSRQELLIETKRMRAVHQWCEQEFYPRWFALLGNRPTPDEFSVIEEKNLQLIAELPLQIQICADKIASEAFGRAAGFAAPVDASQKIALVTAELAAKQAAQDLLSKAKAAAAPDAGRNYGITAGDVKAHLEPIFETVVAELQKSAHQFLSSQLG